MRLGAHLSIAKGPDFTMKIVESIGANCFAFFTRNPQGGSARAISEAEAAQWRAEEDARDIHPLVGHLPYTVNLGTPKDDLFDFAVRVLGEDLRRCEAIGTEYLVVHPGSHLGAGAARTIGRITSAIQKAFAGFSGSTRLLLETMAGQGSEVGSLEEIGSIFQTLGAPKYLGVCLDTCHVFAAGHDIRTHAGIDRMLEAVRCHIDERCIQAVHLNDSKFPLGSRKDRHARIGQGEIGLEGIRSVVTHPKLKDLPFIIETPIEDYLQYGEEVRAVKSALG